VAHISVEMQHHSDPNKMVTQSWSTTAVVCSVDTASRTAAICIFYALLHFIEADEK